MISVVFILITADGLLVAQQRPLSLRDAIELALSQRGSTQARMSDESVRLADARSGQARSALLPHLSASIREERQTRNLEAFGLRADSFFRPPKLVGPFTIFDARANLQQSLFDLSLIRRYQATRQLVEVAREGRESQEEAVAAEVAQLYLEAVRTLARVEAAGANVRLAEELWELARNRRDAGTATGLDVARASVDLSNRRQSVLVADFEHGSALLRLASLIGLDLSEPIRLSDFPALPPGWAPTAQEALAQAHEHRPDLQAQLEQQRAAELRYRAAVAERFPSLVGFANYGTIGTAPTESIPTWVAGLALEIPVFEGGSIRARRQEEAALLRQEQIRSEELRRQIELQVRLALERLHLAEQQVSAALEVLDLARDELGHARRRFESGFSTGIEVTEAMTRLEAARDDHIEALFNVNLANVTLAQAMGRVRDRLAP